MITDVFASQATFRVLLDALSHPGRLVPLPAGVPGDMPPALAVPLALADLGRSVAVVGTDAARWSAHLQATLGCRVVEPHDADEVVALDAATPALVRSLRLGSALAPEDGCRLTLGCARLQRGGRGAVDLTIRGPGIAHIALVGIDGVDPPVLRALVDANSDFPAGVDT
ncbi:MAG: phosphonate C-P lyase system protein PhnH, partial [Chloroflexi bacterium]|nr:phosphonate C-P lyase system protein PhnH [Chloroflexota bacterium]